MPRIRYIKPSFFDDDDVCALKPLTRLLFIGLWCWADKAGRLEDRPQRIKANILPEDGGNINTMLASLEPKFITRYEANGRRYIQINHFATHQRPHVNEVASTIPAPNGYVQSTALGGAPAPTLSTNLGNLQSALGKRDGDGERGKRDGEEGLGRTPVAPLKRGHGRRRSAAARADPVKTRKIRNAIDAIEGRP